MIKMYLYNERRKRHNLFSFNNLEKKQKNKKNKVITCSGGA